MIYYDEYISLGDNCEIGMNFRRIGYEYGSIFRFAMSPYEAMFDALSNDFKDIFESVEPAADNMVFCKKYRVAFHSTLHSTKEDGVRKFKLCGIEFEKEFEQEKSKIKFLVNRMYKDCASGKRLLYILKQNSGLSDNQLKAVKDKLTQLSGKNSFTLVNLSDKISSESMEIDDNIYIEPVQNFSPYIGGWSYDQLGYDELFKKYPLRPDRLKIK